MAYDGNIKEARMSIDIGGIMTRALLDSTQGNSAIETPELAINATSIYNPTSATTSAALVANNSNGVNISNFVEKYTIVLADSAAVTWQAQNNAWTTPANCTVTSSGGHIPASTGSATALSGPLGQTVTLGAIKGLVIKNTSTDWANNVKITATDAWVDLFPTEGDILQLNGGSTFAIDANVSEGSGSDTNGISINDTAGDSILTFTNAASGETTIEMLVIAWADG